MEVPNKMNPLAWLRKHLDDEGGDDVIRQMVKSFADQLMSAEADAMCGAGWGERSPERTNRRNGYRERTFDTRAGTIETRHPEASGRQLLPRLAARAPRRAGSHRGRPAAPGRSAKRPWHRCWRSTSGTPGSPTNTTVTCPAS
ncbi:MAG: transposase [Actinomycetota bacterium]|nr:transposase [Actinomycetota bacterium]